MSRVLFVATDYYLEGGYASYRDFYQLVELAGYPIIPLKQLDPQSDNTYIVTPLNDEWLEGWQAPRARIIHLELEWRFGDWRAETNTPPGVAETWACDKGYADRIGARYVPMGSDSRLCIAGNNVLKEWDVAQISYQTPRRMIVTEQMEARGLKIAQNERLWGAARSMVLNASELMVHVHQTEGGKGIAPLRWCLAAAHHLPMITESVPDAGIFGHSHMRQAEYAWLPEFVQLKLRDKRELANYAHALHQLLCEDWTFKKMIEASI